MKKPIAYQTYGGSFTAKRTARMDFQMPEFSNTMNVQWEFSVDRVSNPKIAAYDMIIGTNLMSEHALDLSFSQMIISWEDLTLPMKEDGLICPIEMQQN